MSTLEAFKKTISVLDDGSTYGILMIDRENPETLYIAKKKSPLLIGVCDGFNVVCSDAMAMLNVTHDFIELHDGEIVELTADEIKIQDANGQPVERKTFHVDEDASASEKGAYEHFMLKEIDEQPAVMHKLVQEYTNEDGSMKIDQDLINAIEDADRLYIVATMLAWLVMNCLKNSPRFQLKCMLLLSLLITNHCYQRSHSSSS